MENKKVRKMDALKREYESIPIPRELDQVVASALEKSRPVAETRTRSRARWSWAACAAAVAVFVGGLNTNLAFAKSLSEVPVLGSLVDVLTVREYKPDKGNYEADIKVPVVNHLGDGSLEHSLNEKYMNEGKELYDNFMADMKDMQAVSEDGHFSVVSGVIVKTETDQMLSVGRYVEETAASSATSIKYDTVDKKNKVLITLPSLFKDDRYIEVISDNIKAQMKRQMAEDPNKIYWPEPTTEIPDGFTHITKEQNFYINTSNQLVISFDEYEVAPGYMGVVEFNIPTDVLEPLLASSTYLK